MPYLRCYSCGRETDDMSLMSQLCGVNNCIGQFEVVWTQNELRQPVYRYNIQDGFALEGSPVFVASGRLDLQCTDCGSVFQSTESRRLNDRCPIENCPGTLRERTTGLY